MAPDVIDLRSDTVTLPSREMRDAIFHAELGDDVYGEDPTVNKLEAMAATALGKEAALFVASGTMGNLISVLGHCQRGDQAIAGDLSHIAAWEQNSASTFGGVSLKTIPNLKDGTFDLSTVTRAINPEDQHCARTKLLCVENTWNGYPLSQKYMQSIRHIADAHQLRVHLDGARIFNSAIAQNVRVDELARDADSIQICFSKGLAAPAGSAICGTREFIAEARRIRKALGGGMRQVGILAAACVFALEKMSTRLGDDHANAKLLAEGLAQFPEIKVEPKDTHTNMVFFRTNLPDDSKYNLVSQLKGCGVLVGVEGSLGIRAVTHYGIEASHIREVLIRVQNCLAQLRQIA